MFKMIMFKPAESPEGELYESAWKHDAAGSRKTVGWKKQSYQYVISDSLAYTSTQLFKHRRDSLFPCRTLWMM